ncbi:DUF881 domain-containing protein [Amphibacillus cookii]|uniref:DUF881 domain-containing protein n=1 Tax=Amphibacillus cookii TaxID=767787 RepID=UPI00195C55DE|nr:DUF881 domain-containing protein [Amphibacillus cookii]MBM7540482.1 uncharacterized protein YlxW (UPF0749 family) [Amphibacillus cookii]
MVKKQIIFSVLLALLGFLLVGHLRSTRETEGHETKDNWEIRLQLQEEQARQQDLQQELNDLNTIKLQYETKSEQEQIEALYESIDLLEMKAGLTELRDSGIVIELTPNYQQTDQSFPELKPELLTRLINELNAYGAEAISVENERIIDLTAIRYVKSKTYINQRPLPDLPLEVKVISTNPERIHSYMEVSQIRNAFAMHNISMEINLKDEVIIPPYQDDLNLEYIRVSDQQEEGDQ